MKKLIVLAVMACCSTSLFAQQYWDGSRPDHRLTVGLRAGGNFSNSIITGTGQTMTSVWDSREDWR